MASWTIDLKPAGRGHVSWNSCQRLYRAASNIKNRPIDRSIFIDRLDVLKLLPFFGSESLFGVQIFQADSCIPCDHGRLVFSLEMSHNMHRLESIGEEAKAANGARARGDGGRSEAHASEMEPATSLQAALQGISVSGPTSGRASHEGQLPLSPKVSKGQGCAGPLPPRRVRVRGLSMRRTVHVNGVSMTARG